MNVTLLRHDLERAASTSPRAGAPVAPEIPLCRAGTLCGEPASRGVVTGRCRVVSGEDLPADLAEGEILIVHRFPMHWVPALSHVGAVVTEAGSVLDNVAILAREYGVPAVVDARDATHLLRSGQVVTVDGNAGSIRY